MSDADLIKNMSRKVNELYLARVTQEGICKALADMVRENDAPKLNDVIGKAQKLAKEAEHVKTVAECLEAIADKCELHLLCYDESGDSDYRNSYEVVEVEKAIKGVDK